MHISFQAKHVMMVIPNQEMDAQVLVLSNPPFTAQLAILRALVLAVWRIAINAQMLQPAKPVPPAIVSMAHHVYFVQLLALRYVVIRFINPLNYVMMEIYSIMTGVVLIV